MAGPVPCDAFLSAGAGLAQASPPLAPVVLLVLCVLAGVGTVLALPSRRETPFRKLGGALLLLAGLILVAILVQWAADVGEGGMGVYFWIFATIGLVGAVRVITHPKPVYSALYFVLTVFATAGLFVLLWAEFMAVALVLIYAGAILITYVFVIMLAAEATHAGGSMAPGGLAEHDAVSREPVAVSAIGFALMGLILFVIFDRSEPLVRARDAEQARLAAALAAEPAPPPIEQEIAESAPSEPAPIEPAPVELTPVEPETAVVPEKIEIAPTHVTAATTYDLGQFLFRRHVLSLQLAGLILTIAMVGAIIIARRRVSVTAAEMPGMLPAEPAADVVLGPATPIDDNPHSLPVVGTLNPRHKEYPEA